MSAGSVNRYSSPADIPALERNAKSRSIRLDTDDAYRRGQEGRMTRREGL